VVEAITKIISVAPIFSKYFLNPWDLFDFIITIISFVPAVGPMITIVRLVRLLRIVRIVRKFDNLRVIIEALIKSLSSMAIVFMLLLLLLYVYGIMGVYLFREVDPQFWGTLGSSIITLFTIATLTNWDVRLVNTLSAHPFAWVYFFSFVIIAAMILINLFVGIMLHNVTDANKRNLEKKGILTQDETMLKELKEIKESIKKLEKKKK
jgi:voltage-gated sodium channel